jgi:hypothetical protein
MARRTVIPNGTLMRWQPNKRRDELVNVRVLMKVKRAKGEWQKYHVQRVDTGKTFVVQGNVLFEPVPKFNTIEEADAWLEAHRSR